MEETLRALRNGRPNSHVLIRAERSAFYSRALPLGLNKTIGYRPNRPPSRNETIRPRDRAWSRPLRQGPLNRETLSDRLTPLAIPQRTTNHPEQPIERSKHDSQTRPKDSDTRIDDEPLHHEADRTSASVTITRRPMLGPHATRVVERARERDAIAKTHFQSNLSHWTYWYVAGLCHTVSYDVNTMLLQCAPNLFNLLLIHATNANTTVNLAITVLNNFELKRDTVQTKNDFPAQ